MAVKVLLPLDGGCQCGAVRFRISTPPEWISNCHCTNCQKISGGAFAVNAIVAEDVFTFLKGAPKRTEWIAASGNRRYGLFCGDCGARIVHGQTPSSGYLSLRCGGFDDKSWVEPVGDIWTASAQPWIRFVGERIEWPGQPSDHRPFLERYKAQGRFAH